MRPALTKFHPEVDYDEVIYPRRGMAALKAMVARGYETARLKHPELPRALTSFAEHNRAEIAEAKAKHVPVLSR